ncbi:Ff.00g077890.m01.CDS01 [Fusarium sp. VM40]|nr:Ff.00g077890.m01.CDS01 [Fusarium sp. VM40]
MQFVASHTRISIPRLYVVHVEKETGSIFIEMAYIKGACLESAWNRLSTGERDTVFVDIKQHLSWLRELQPPAQDIVSSAYENLAYNCRIGARSFGPMHQHECHSLAREHIMEDVAPFLSQKVSEIHKIIQA